MARTITSADAVYILSCVELGISVQLQGFAADNAFDTDSAAVAQTMIGVDGKKSAGYTPRLYSQNIHLQADSESRDTFDVIATASDASRKTYRLDAVISFPQLSKSYVLANGTLTNYKVMSDAKTVLQPTDFTIVWESTKPIPLG